MSEAYLVSMAISTKLMMLMVDISIITVVANSSLLLSSINNLSAQLNSTNTVIKSSGISNNNTSHESIKKVAILTFDDAWKSQIVNAKPILDKYGFKVTFFIVCNYVGKDNSRMNWQDVTVLRNDGQDIQSHTMNHKALNKMPAKQLDYEVGQSKQCLIDHGITKPVIFATPYNEGWNNLTVIKSIAKYYDLARNGNAEPMFLHCDKWDSAQHDCRTFFDNGTLTFANRYSIRGWSHNFYDNKYSHNKTMIFDKFVEVVNNQLKYNQKVNNANGTSGPMSKIDAIPVLEYHNVDNSRTSYSTAVNLFELEMAYLHDNGITVLPMNALKFDNSTSYLYIK